jgi:hypothetical protein
MGFFGRDKRGENPKGQPSLSPIPQNCVVNLTHLMPLQGNHRMPEWMDLIQVWEVTYPLLRKEQGWVISKWFDADRLKIEWTVGEHVVVAEINRETGLIKESLKRNKGR